MVSHKEKNASVLKKEQASDGRMYNSLYALGEYIFSVMLSLFSAIKSGFLAFMDRNEDGLIAIGKWFRKTGRKLAILPLQNRKAAVTAQCRISKWTI